MGEDGRGWERTREDGRGWERTEGDGRGRERMEENGRGWERTGEDIFSHLEVKKPHKCKRDTLKWWILSCFLTFKNLYYIHFL